MKSGSRTVWIVVIVAALAAASICAMVFGALAVLWRTGENLVWGEEGHRVSVSGSGDLVTLEEPFTGFDGIEVSHDFEVKITQRDRYQTVIRVDDNLADYVEVVKRGNTLSIGLKPGWSYQIRDTTMYAEVSMPSLRRVTLSGASQVSITGFESLEGFQACLSGASSLRGDLRAGDARLDVSGASQVVLRGTAGEMALIASGASKVRLDDFRATDTRVEASGASDVTVHASGRLDAEASGVSRVTYLGSPTLGRIETSLGSSVTPR
jgi:hypothetical protein